MTTRFRVQQLDGRVLNRLPQGPQITLQETPLVTQRMPPFVINMFVGDSNFLGRDTLYDTSLDSLLPGGTVFSDATEREIASTVLANNWKTNAVEASTALTSPGRNAAATNLSFGGVRRDLGASAATGPPLTLDPMWSLAAHLQHYYEENLQSGDGTAAGTGTFKQAETLGNANLFGQLYIKHAIDRCGFARQVTTRAYNTDPNPASAGMFDNEFAQFENAATLHPEYDAATTLFGNLTQSFDASLSILDVFVGGAMRDFVYFDTVYINAMSFDIKHLGGSQMATNWLAFRDALKAHLGFSPNIVCVAPLIGPFEPDRIEYSTRASQLVKAQLPGAAWVDASDLALNGLNHLTGRSAVELGRRLAMARAALPDAVIRQI